MTDTTRLAWQCRRGTRELDILLRGFLDDHFVSLSYDQQEAFRNLLQVQDPVLIEWFWGQSPPPKEFSVLIARIREHASAQHIAQHLPQYPSEA